VFVSGCPRRNKHSTQGEEPQGRRGQRQRDLQHLRWRLARVVSVERSLVFVAADIMMRLAMMKRQSSSMAGSEAYRFVIFQRETKRSFDNTVKCIVVGRTSAKEVT
jgi:hypothetical protein